MTSITPDDFAALRPWAQARYNELRLEGESHEGALLEIEAEAFHELCLFCERHRSECNCTVEARP
jgi:hypothetical protein